MHYFLNCQSLLFFNYFFPFLKEKKNSICGKNMDTYIQNQASKWVELYLHELIVAKQAKVYSVCSDLWSSHNKFSDLMISVIIARFNFSSISKNLFFFCQGILFYVRIRIGKKLKKRKRWVVSFLFPFSFLLLNA